MSNCPCICFRLVSLSELLPTFSWVARCCWILSDRRNLVFRRNICDPHLFRIFELIDGKAIVLQHCPSSLLTTFSHFFGIIKVLNTIYFRFPHFTLWLRYFMFLRVKLSTWIISAVDSKSIVWNLLKRINVYWWFYLG